MIPFEPFSGGAAMRQVRYLAGLLLSGFVLAGCVNSRIHMPYTPLFGPTPAPDTRQADNTFDYGRKGFNSVIFL